jgi:tetratricopeptide (TPR) repeat protein
MPSLTLDQALQLAIEHHRAGRHLDAESIYRQILAVAPGHADALHLLGVLSGQPTAARKADPRAAVEFISRAVALHPGNPVYFSNLSNFLHALGRHDDAIAAARQALALDPSHVQALANLANALLARGDNAAAIDVCRQALAIQPHFAEAHANLGIALRRTGDLDGAVAAYREALRLRPTPVVYNDLAIALAALRRFDDAIAALHEALRLQPQYAQAWNNLGTTLKDLARLDEAADAYRQALRLEPQFAEAHTGLISVFMYQPDADAATLRDALADWERRHAAVFSKSVPPHPNDRTPHRRLRVGYVSADFREHVVARNILPFLRRHRREDFEIFL